MIIKSPRNRDPQLHKHDMRLAQKVENIFNLFFSNKIMGQHKLVVRSGGGKFGEKYLLMM